MIRKFISFEYISLIIYVYKTECKYNRQNVNIIDITHKYYVCHVNLKYLVI